MIPAEDLKIESYPKTSQGGQHAGSTYGVMVTHLPTGTIAVVKIDRSQHKNKSIAVHMIEAALTDPEFRG
jgi:protein subunit release factor A